MIVIVYQEAEPTENTLYYSIADVVNRKVWDRTTKAYAAVPANSYVYPLARMDAPILKAVMTSAEPDAPAPDNENQIMVFIHASADGPPIDKIPVFPLQVQPRQTARVSVAFAIKVA